MVKTVIVGLVWIGISLAQGPPLRTLKCIEWKDAFGPKHVKFSPEDQVQLLLAKDRGSKEYWVWENMARKLNWTSGTKLVDLGEVKSHFPRAVLFSGNIPTSPKVKVNEKDLAELISAELAYGKVVQANREVPWKVIEKYKIGPGVTFDDDFGGGSPRGECLKTEETFTGKK